MGFDWYRDGSSTTSAWHTPVLRLHIFDELNGQPFFSELIWEAVYNGYPVAGPGVPTDTWMSMDLTSDLFHRWVTGAGPTMISGAQVNWTPDMWASSNLYSASATIYQIGIGAGSGWSDTFLGFADNMVLEFAGSPAHEWNFEVSQQVVPEPMTVLLLGTGRAGVAVLRRRRRANA